MADPRRYIGVRISEQGHRYIQLVADRDKTNYSAALRHLLALGVRSDMEAHDDSRIERMQDPRADQSSGVRELGTDGSDDRDRHSDRSSNEVSHLPDRGPANVGDAIGHLYRAGLNPAPVQASEDDNSAA